MKLVLVSNYGSWSRLVDRILQIVNYHCFQSELSIEQRCEAIWQEIYV